MMRLLLAGCAILMLSATAVAADQTFSPRLQAPRVAPLEKGTGTPAQQAMLASRPDFNIYKTLAHHVDLYSRWSPLGQFVLQRFEPAAARARDRDAAHGVAVPVRVRMG
ncbi:MAG: hypothetical protein HC868_12680, partial [Sphingomonadales bacterium]|nr:hypothetical protein [Sphingomonadales bacterium]